jgi:fused signal recognition particle receptor
MFSLFKKKNPSPLTPNPIAVDGDQNAHENTKTLHDSEPENASWLDRLSKGLKRTRSEITQVFTGTQIDEALYEQLEEALLLSDAGPQATNHILEALKVEVKNHNAKDPLEVKALLVQVLQELLQPLEATLPVQDHNPCVIMVCGVNGAGKTTSIGKLTQHLSAQSYSVLLAAADTFRAAAREQLESWAHQNQVEIISQTGADPAAVAFDSVSAGLARKKDVVIIDTAGRLPTQLHLMQELQKIKRVIEKAHFGAPHEVLLVVDGNTGQNALAQVKAFDEALGLTGLIVTKLDGTAKGGMLASIALWGAARVKSRGRNVPVYFIGVGEQLQDLQSFVAKEFAKALIEA